MSDDQSTATLTRTLRDGRIRTWKGILLRQGTMTLSSTMMEYVVIRTDRGVECFAIDPAFATRLEVGAS